MNTKEEKTIDLEQIIEEERLRLKELSEDELTEVSGGNGNEAAFEKGKWVKLPGDEPTGDITVFELCELNGDNLIVAIWKNIYDSSEGKRKVLHARNVIMNTDFLKFVVDTTRPEWAYD